MPDNNGRPNTLEDYLTSVKRDNGKHMKFGFNPIVTENDKIYANLAVSYTHLTLPTNREV